jgi:hypothetical protein
MKSGAIIAQLPVLFVSAAGWLQDPASNSGLKSPTKFVDNFVGKWVQGWLQAAPALACDRTLTN